MTRGEKRDAADFRGKPLSSVSGAVSLSRLSSLWLEVVGRRENPVQFKGRVRAVGGARGVLGMRVGAEALEAAQVAWVWRERGQEQLGPGAVPRFSGFRGAGWGSVTDA